jgi:hypothetical protein
MKVYYTDPCSPKADFLEDGKPIPSIYGPNIKEAKKKAVKMAFHIAKDNNKKLYYFGHEWDLNYLENQEIEIAKINNSSEIKELDAVALDLDFSVYKKYDNIQNLIAFQYVEDDFLLRLFPDAQKIG